MKKLIKLYTSGLVLTGLSLGALMILSGCGSQFAKPTLPPVIGQMQASKTNLVWVGTGESYRYQNDKWERTPEQDYEFTVLQRRYQDRWESIKNLHRRHPNYNGVAGPRDNAWYFKFAWQAPKTKQVDFEIKTSIGNGSGTTDIEFRKFKIEIQAKGVSSFAPYNTYRLTQEYQYEQGLLLETIELIKKDKTGQETPFVRILEKAKIFSHKKLSGPPTVAK